MRHVITQTGACSSISGTSPPTTTERGEVNIRESITPADHKRTGGVRARNARARRGRDGRTRGVVAAGPRSRTILTFRDAPSLENRTRL